MTKENFDYPNPDIFRAAMNDDASEMRAALEAGQSLDQTEPDLHMTPIHIACIKRSTTFLQAASEHQFNPWLRDDNLRVAFDHATANNFKEGQKILYEKMYPPGWADKADVVPFSPK